MKQKIYKLKSNTLSRFLIGIACRNQNDSIAGLFVNTDPYDSIMCRETEFQTKKIELLIDQGYENEILKIANVYQQKQNLSIFQSVQEIVKYIQSLKEDEASKFTRISGLDKLSPKGWHEGEKHNIMANIQRDFIKNGGKRGKEYAITALALYNLEIAIIESSKTDSYWGVKAEYVSKIGKGANELGTIHTIIGKELKEAAKDISTGKFIYNGIELDLELVEKKQKEIEKARSDEKLNIMNIKYNRDKFNTIEIFPIKKYRNRTQQQTQYHNTNSTSLAPSLTPNYTPKNKAHIR